MTSSRMRVLVSGGAGYIGSVVVAELLRVGHDVIVVDDLSTGHRAAVAPGAHLIVADLAVTAALPSIGEHIARTVGGLDAIVHMAALSIIKDSMARPEQYLRDNTAMTCNLVELANQAGATRFVFSSSASVYGIPERVPMAESEPLLPMNGYGESKLFGERVLSWAHRQHRLGIGVLRYMNAAGATADHGEDHRPETHLMPLVLEVALGRRAKITLQGVDYPTPDGTCIRDYVHVLDIARAHVAALDWLGPGKELVVNVGTGQGFSVREVVDMTARVTGRPIPIEVGPRRPGDPPVLCAEATRIREVLGWAPQCSSLEDLVASAWQWRQRHPDGYPD